MCKYNIVSLSKSKVYWYILNFLSPLIIFDIYVNQFQETLSQSVTTNEDQDNMSVLSRALNVVEYPGRVRGKGHGVTPSSLYKHPRKINPTMTTSSLNPFYFWINFDNFEICWTKISLVMAFLPKQFQWWGLNFLRFID